MKKKRRKHYSIFDKSGLYVEIPPKGTIYTT